jgi:hypothetical protein
MNNPHGGDDMQKSILPASIAMLVITFLSIFPATTQTVRAQQPPPLPFQYAAKFICGIAPIEKLQLVARGTYFTSINIHNPLVGAVSFRKRIVVIDPGDTSVIRRFADSQLPGEGALNFSCRDIAERLSVVFSGTINTTPRPSFFEGFVVIESRTELDVVALYTTGTTGLISQRVTTMNLERVPVRLLAQPDLVPAPDARGTFCRRDETGRLIVTIKNEGTADAGGSITRIEFANGEHQLVTTPAIPAGGSVDVFVTFPPSCFNPSCTFRIAADSTGIVSETNEGNNAAGGTCGV